MSLDLNELMEENQRLTTQGGSYLDNYVLIPDGNCHFVMRLLPPAARGMFGREKNPFYAPSRVHRLNGRYYHCLKTLVDKKWVGDCPVCLYYNWLWKESERQSPDLATQTQNKARAIKPIDRYYYNVLVRQQVNQKTQEVEANVGPKIWAVGKTIHGSILKFILGDKTMDIEPLGDVTDPKTGRDFKLIKVMKQSGKDSFPTYNDSKFLAQSPLGEPEQAKTWLTNLHDLVAIRDRGLLEHDVLDHQLKIHLGIEKDDSTDFDPTQYQAGGATKTTATVTKEEPDIDSVVGASASKTVTKAPVVEAESSKSLDEDDFMNQIKNIDLE